MRSSTEKSGVSQMKCRLRFLIVGVGADGELYLNQYSMDIMLLQKKMDV